MDNLIIPIVMAVNHNYLCYAAVSIQSMLDTKNTDLIYNICILHTELSTEDQNNIKKLQRPDVIISFQKISSIVHQQVNTLYLRAHYSREMYFRWWIGELFPEYDKVIYLDCDTMVFCDFSPLFEINVEDVAIGGVVDFATPKVVRRIERQLGLQADQYINTGVLLINTAMWRTERFLDSCLNLLKKSSGLSCPDQDILNVICKDSIMHLEPKWNVQWQHLWDNPDDCLKFPFQDMFLESIKNPCILHFTSSIKPWNCPSNPYADIFFHYYEKLPINLKNMKKQI